MERLIANRGRGFQPDWGAKKKKKERPSIINSVDRDDFLDKGIGSS